MRIQSPVHSAAHAAPSGVMGSPAESAPTNECEGPLCFADALEGLAGAEELVGFDAADGVPLAAGSEAARGEAAGSGVAGGEAAKGAAVDSPATVEIQSMPALTTPLAIAITMPSVMPVAMPLAMPAGSAEPAPPATALADQDIRLAKTGSSPLAGPKSPLAAPVDSIQRGADAAGPTTPFAPLPADSSGTGNTEVLQPKLKVDNGTVSEHKAVTTPEVSVSASAAPVSTAVPESSVSNPAPVLKLPAGTPEQWRRPLMEALGDRIQVEVGKHSEQAVIRLDPPMLGSVEIAIRHQAGVLQVQLSASHDEVVRQLQHIGDSLRQDLSRNQYTDVSVQVFAGSRDGDGRQRPDAQPEERQPGRALAEAEAEAEAEQTSSPFVLSSDRD